MFLPLLTLLTTPVTPLASESRAAPRTWPIALHQAMQRTADVEWRLRSAAGSSCPAMAAASGLVLDSLDSYDAADRAMVTASLGMSDRAQVAAVAAGSPAAEAGIVPGDDIVTINGRDIVARTADAASDQSSQKTRALRGIAALAQLPAGQRAQVVLDRAGAMLTVALTPKTLCASRFFVSTQNGRDAYSDGIDIVISARLVDFTRSADELALLGGHELAHAIAQDTKASGIGERRRMEDRADALGTDLAACAGYDTKAAASFWGRWSQSTFLDFLSDSSHASGKKRTAATRRRPPPPACPITGAPPL